MCSESHLNSDWHCVFPRQVERLRREVAEKDSQIKAMQEQHTHTLLRLKRDQDLLLSKVQELEEVLADL